MNLMIHRQQNQEQLSHQQRSSHMVKYWIKNRFAFDLLLSVILSLVFSFAFVFSANSNYSYLCSKNSLYLNSDIDYQIPNPSVDQLKDINSEPFIDETFGYYLTKTDFNGSKSAKVNLIMSDCMGNLDFTMFNQKTLISDSSTASENYAYLDETAALSMNVKVGDTINTTIAGSKVGFLVNRVYAANALFTEGIVLVNFSGNIKNIYEANVSSKSYSGAFIKASNVSECSEFLKSYVPLGRLKERSEFDSDEAYNKYNDEIKSGNYANEITDFATSRNNAEKAVKSAKKNRFVMSLIGAIVVGIIYFAGTQILRIRKSENTYFADVLKNKKDINKYRVLSLISTIVVYLLVSTLVLFALSALDLVFIPSLIAVIMFIIAFAINLIQDKKYSKTGK